MEPTVFDKMVRYESIISHNEDMPWERVAELEVDVVARAFLFYLPSTTLFTNHENDPDFALLPPLGFAVWILFSIRDDALRSGSSQSYSIAIEQPILGLGELSLYTTFIFIFSFSFFSLSFFFYLLFVLVFSLSFSLFYFFFLPFFLLYDFLFFSFCNFIDSEVSVGPGSCTS
ncbi:hypothetical protein JCGZ_01977 [Jatropha curcas]|uniref:Uncharacterized protein n=1 Tax=Jatropha curcas TaxID=180498 RepID=A0A067JJA3_JATCU|nr:hypothetical protein JCGZ_01977 [Jatropha curcas]